MERNNRGKFWTILSAVLGIGLLALLYFSTQTDAQLFGKRSVYKIFQEGADDYKATEYEKAKVCFDQVKARSTELKPDQVKDLIKWIEFNDLALAGRKKYEETLVKAETAFKQGRVEEVDQCLKELKANPYPSAAQRLRTHNLECHRHGCAEPQNWKELFKSAKVAFNNGELDQAELFARDSIVKRPFIVLPSLDTPEKLLDQIQAEPTGIGRGKRRVFPGAQEQVLGQGDSERRTQGSQQGRAEAGAAAPRSRF